MGKQLELRFTEKAGPIKQEAKEFKNPKIYQGTLFKIVDYLLTIRKKIKDSQPVWYRENGF